MILSFAYFYFSDCYHRGIIMVGLPFANRNSVELLEKMQYAKEHTNHINVSLMKANKRRKGLRSNIE